MQIPGIRMFSIALSAFTLAACGGGSGGGGSDSGPTTRSGVFLDSPVAGLAYAATPSGLSGLTDSQGRFDYQDGDTVTFSIGNITLGSGSGGAQVTPLSLVSGANGDINHPTVRNVARLLQSLDDDGDPSNGITITDATRTAAQALTSNQIDVTGNDFESEAGGLIDELTAGNTSPRDEGDLVSEQEAAAHLADSIAENDTSANPHTGSYQIAATDDSFGYAHFVVNPSGSASGIVYIDGVAIDLTGSVDVQGLVSLSDGADVTVAVTIDAQGGVAGTASDGVTTVDVTGSEDDGAARGSDWNDMVWDQGRWG